MPILIIQTQPVMCISPGLLEDADSWLFRQEESGTTQGGKAEMCSCHWPLYFKKFGAFIVIKHF